MLTSVFYKTLLLLVQESNNVIDPQMYKDDVSCFGFDGAAGVGVINGQNQSFTDNFDNGNYDVNFVEFCYRLSIFGVVVHTADLMLYILPILAHVLATTNPLGISGGSQVSFILKLETLSTSSCENADAGEDVVLEYSTNGTTRLFL